MRIIIAIIKKEFLQVFRNKLLAKIIFLAPLLQLIVLTYAANLEIKGLAMGVIDRDNTTMTRELKNAFTSSSYFSIYSVPMNYDAAMKQFENDELDVLIEIPYQFEKDILAGLHPDISISINSINSMKAGVASSYVGDVISTFVQNKMAQEMIVQSSPMIKASFRDWYNPKFDYKTFMLSGILCVLITVVGVLLTSLNIVREKEIGTIEQLNVTPISKFQFIIGKLLPFGIIGVFQLTLGLLICILIFDMKIEGSLVLIYLMVMVYLVGLLGIGFLISTIAETQSQAMFLTLFCMFMFILMSGLFTPIESMPNWAQQITKLNPTSYLIESMRLVIIKGSGFASVRYNLMILSIFAVVVNGIVVLNYRKVN